MSISDFNRQAHAPAGFHFGVKRIGVGRVRFEPATITTSKPQGFRPTLDSGDIETAGVSIYKNNSPSAILIASPPIPALAAGWNRLDHINPPRVVNPPWYI